MAVPSLFPQFLKGGTGAGGGTINRAIISELEVELVEFEAELPAPLVAELPTPVEADLPEPIEVETC